MTRECFTRAFLESILPRELRESKAQEFKNLRQGSMSVQEYRLKFIQFFRYAPHVVVDPKAHISKFLFRVFDLVKTKCKNVMLFEGMVSRLMNDTHQVKGDKLKEIAKVNKKATTLNYEH